MGNVVNFKPKPPAIEVELVDKRFSTRWMCTVCGDCTAKGSIVAEGREDLSSGDYHVGEHRIIRVCEYCLDAGDIDARLELGARQLEAQARHQEGHPQQQPSVHPLNPFQGLGHPREARGAQCPVEETDAVEQQGRGEGSQQDVLDPGLVGLGVVAGIGRQDIKAEAQQLQ